MAQFGFLPQAPVPPTCPIRDGQSIAFQTLNSFANLNLWTVFLKRFSVTMS
jgi:hypothetical protein